MFQSLINWRLRTPFYYGWLVLAITAIATFAASGLTQVVLAVYRSISLKKVAGRTAA